MSDPNSVQIKFGADISDLKQKVGELGGEMSKSKAAFDGAAVSAKQFAAALAATGNDLSKIPAYLKQQAQAADEAGAALRKQMDANLAKRWAESLKAEADAAKEAAKAHDGLSFSTTGAKRELIVLAHEMSQGN